MTIRRFVRTIVLLRVLTLPLALTGCESSDVADHSNHTDGVLLAQAADKDNNVVVTVHGLVPMAETGEPIVLRVTVEAPTSSAASLILPEETRLGAFDLLAINDVQTPTTNLDIALQKELTISTFESGVLELPPFLVSFNGSSELRTKPIAFEISSLIEGEFDPNDFADIHGAIDDRTLGVAPAWLVPVAIGSSIAIAGLAAIALVLVGRRQRRPTDPATWALAELVRIELLGPPRQENTTERYELIESVLRWFISFEYHIDAPEQTSLELVTAVLNNERITDDARAVLQFIIHTGDRVKFAGGIATVDQCADALQAVRGFVEATPAIDDSASSESAA